MPGTGALGQMFAITPASGLAAIAIATVLMAVAGEPLSFDFVIVAKIEIHQADRTKVAGFTVTVSDLGLRQLAARADTEALVNELEHVHQAGVQPPAALQL